MSEKQIRRLLEGNFFPPSLEPGVIYERCHDDHDGEWQGRLKVGIDRQGDVWFCTDVFRHMFTPMRFRTFGGGGASLRVRNALLILAEAIRLDNEERPQEPPNHPTP